MKNGVRATTLVFNLLLVTASIEEVTCTTYDKETSLLSCPKVSTIVRHRLYMRLFYRGSMYSKQGMLQVC